MTQELAEKFLDQAEELVESGGEGDDLLDALESAQQFDPEDTSILCRSARVLFRFGILNSKGRFLLLALEKLTRAFDTNPQFFESRYFWWQLWGNILVQLGKLVQDPSLFEMALEKYQKAAECTEQNNPDLCWDWADAWILLGQKSGELTDFQQGLAKFDTASRQGLNSPFFWLDYGHALTLYGERTGQFELLNEAISYFEKVIDAAYATQEKGTSIVYVAAWRKLAIAAKIRYQLSHLPDHFDEADKSIREAILSSPKNGELWLDWAEHFLLAGWLRKDLKQIEVALEKLTANKVKECEPLRVSYLLGMSLTMYALFLENLKLLKEGNERIQAALEIAPTSTPLNFAAGFAEMGFGLYFGDTAAFVKAIQVFWAGVEENAACVECWYALFQTYMAWGLQENDAIYIQKGLDAIQRLCQLRPCSSIHLNEWGVALLRMRGFQEDRDGMQICVEEAIAKFQKAWELSENEEALYNWGCAYDLLGDITGDEEHYGKSIDLLSKALDKKPTNLQIRYHLGLALSHLGELVLNADCLAQAIEFLEAVSKIETEDENVWCDYGYALLNLAQAIDDPHHPQESDNRRREAEKALLRSAELGSGDAYYHLACLYSLTGLNEASLHFLGKASVADTLPSLEDLEQDEWLEGVRDTPAFREFITARDYTGGDDA